MRTSTIPIRFIIILITVSRQRSLVLVLDRFALVLFLAHEMCATLMPKHVQSIIKAQLPASATQHDCANDQPTSHFWIQGRAPRVGVPTHAMTVVEAERLSESGIVVLDVDEHSGDTYLINERTQGRVLIKCEDEVELEFDDDKLGYISFTYGGAGGGAHAMDSRCVQGCSCLQWALQRRRTHRDRSEA